jgi:glycosyltransferase involved in cell wall biosynthesis
MRRFFLITDMMTHYRARMMAALASGLVKASKEEYIVYMMSGHDERLNQADVVLGVDIARPEYLAPNVRYITWVQDLISWPHGNRVPRLDTYGAQSRPDDIIYTLGDGRSVGIDEADPHWRGSLADAVDPALLHRPRKQPGIDLSLCTYIPPPIDQIEGLEGYWSAVVKRLLREYYTPLQGELDPLGMYGRIKGELESEDLGFDWAEHFKSRSQEVKWMVVQYSRLLDRLKIARMMLEVSKECEFRGGNWEHYSEFAEWVQPHTNDTEVLYNAFQRGKINLHVNITGFGIHSRVLDCMAMNCFIMSHTTPRDCVGQLTECFEPDVHYGVFTPENFKERARYWLDNQEEREAASAEAFKLVQAHHLWEHRAAKILKDLKEG